jgi:hypothetical protein
MQFLTLAVAALASLALVAGAPIEKRSQRGKATYYYQNGQPGSCGNYAGDNDRVVAISSKFKSARKCGGKLKVSARAAERHALQSMGADPRCAHRSPTRATARASLLASPTPAPPAPR